MTPGLDARALSLPLPARAQLGEEALHRRLAAFNRRRLQPTLPDARWTAALQEELKLRLHEARWLEGERHRLRDPSLPALEADGLLDWFAALRRRLPGGADGLCAWLAAEAELEPLRWLLRQEAAADADIEQALLLVAPGLPAPSRAMLVRQHAEMLGGDGESLQAQRARLTLVLRLQPLALKDLLWESLALNNLMLGLASERRYAWHALGALAARGLSQAARLPSLCEGLHRLGIPAPARQGLQRQAELARSQSSSLLTELIAPLARDDRLVARAMAEGALLRLRAEERCAARYRQELELPPALRPSTAAPARDT